MSTEPLMQGALLVQKLLQLWVCIMKASQIDQGAQLPPCTHCYLSTYMNVPASVKLWLQIPWQDLTEAGPAFITLIVMPTTNNIAYGCIAGIIAYIIVKFVTYGLHESQKRWWGYDRFKRWTEVSTTRCSLAS